MGVPQLWLRQTCVCALTLAWACADPIQPMGDTGVKDAGSTDDGGRDQGVRDTGPVDDGIADLGDAATQDASADAGDSGPLDNGIIDSGDAGTPDVMVVEVDQFASGLNPCGLGFDHVFDVVWVVACSANSIQGFGIDGIPAITISIAGETPNDVDIDIAPESLRVGASTVAEGALLFINGETGPADIYAIDKAGAGVVAVLNTAFGAAHVVGGGYHSDRDTFFLVQDRNGGAVEGNRVAEIDPVTGAILSSFQTTPDYIVNFGDLDVCQSTGDLYVVSSVESTIARFDADGRFIAEYPLPASVASAAGIDFDDPSGDAWISGTNGQIWRVSGLPCAPR